MAELPAPEGPNLRMRLASGLFTIAAFAGSFAGSGLRVRPIDGLASVAIAAAILFASIVAHELGHLVAGLGAGYSFDFFKSGPLTVSRREGKLHVAFLERGGIRAIGLASVVPRTPDPSRRMRAVLVLGGPLASLSITAAGVVFLAAGGAGSPWSRFSAAFLAAHSFLTGFLNLVPYRSSGYPSDGLQLLEILKKRQRGSARAR
ncbi:MAG: hypothetical protein HY720_22770 [Planctomycetes bacterium]|nr:hypothetical protein [Planctomycetota bacterium]